MNAWEAGGGSAGDRDGREDQGCAGDRFGAWDGDVLDRLRECYAQLDPMPPGLVERSLFALALEDIDTGLVRVAAERDLEPVGTRGEEEARVITFESESVTVMIRISPQDGVLRIDGWLVPPEPRPVDLRTAGGTLTAYADEQGRFVLEPVLPGLARLAVGARVRDGRDPGDPPDETVLTPAIVL